MIPYYFYTRVPSARLFRTILRFNYFSTQAESLTIPAPNEASKVYPVKIQKMVEDISQLTLVEVSELSTLLKKTLNLPDTPMMAMGGNFMPAQAQSEAEDEPEVREVQTAFTVKLLKYDESKKIGIIKEIKSIMQDMNLVQAKKFVESAPTVVKSNISKDEADKIKEALSQVGGDIMIE